jgi:hypothetical protein
MANEIQKLKNINASTYPENKLRDLVKHLQDQMNNTYAYWVGEWNNAHRAKSTRTSKFASKKEVINYLNNV